MKLEEFKKLNKEHKQKVEDARKNYIKAVQELQNLVDQCSHNFKPLTEKQQNDPWMSEGAVCLICGSHFGWRCKLSPLGYCVYNLGDGIYDCTYCGLPDERK